MLIVWFVPRTEENAVEELDLIGLMNRNICPPQSALPRLITLSAAMTIALPQTVTDREPPVPPPETRMRCGIALQCFDALERNTELIPPRSVQR